MSIRRRLTGLSLTALGLDAIVGMGVYILPGQMAALLGGWSVLAFPLCGLLLTCVALTYAHLSEHISRSGGPYVYTLDLFSEGMAFYVGWTHWLGASMGLGATGRLLAMLLSGDSSDSQLSLWPKVLSIVAIFFFGFLNYLGISYGAMAMVICTILKLLPLVLVGVASLWMPSAVSAVPLKTDFSLAGLSEATVMALFICQGFEIIPSIAGEAKRPKYTVPRAVLTSLWLAVALYALLQIGIASGPAVGTATPLIVQAKHLWGDTGEVFMKTACILSIIGFIAGRSLASPRLLAVMGEDKLVPAALGELHPRYGTPTKAVVISTMVGVLFCAAVPLSYFVNVSALAVALQYLIASVALLIYARRKVWRFGRARVAYLSLAVSLFFLCLVDLKAYFMLFLLLGAGYVVRRLDRGVYVVHRLVDKLGVSREGRRVRKRCH